MSDVLNFYLEKYGLIEKQEEKKPIHLDDKARERWNALKRNIRNVSELVSQDDLKNSKLVHGIKFLRDIEHDESIKQVFYLGGDIDRYVTLDGKSIRMIDDMGRVKNMIRFNSIDVPFNRLVYIMSCSRIVAYSQDNSQLYLLNLQFQLIEKVDVNLTRNECFRTLLLNEDRNEIISCQQGSIISIWELRYANKHLIPRLFFHVAGLDHNPQVIWAIERTQSKYQRLFLAIQSNIECFQLADAQRLLRSRNVHDRNITCMTFFNPLKRLITGCEDGSVKVWSTKFLEQDVLQLAMVFVGHNGSVRSLNFFPGGSQATVISSGSDETLRVWNLEVLDQVQALELSTNVSEVCSDITKSSFVTISGNTLQIWEQHQLYEEILLFPTPVTYMANVSQLLMIETPLKLPQHSILAYCKQTSVAFLVNSYQPQDLLMKTVAQTKAKEFISCFIDSGNCHFYVLLKNNILQKYDARDDPMILEDVYEVPFDRRKYDPLLTLLDEDDERLTTMNLSVLSGYITKHSTGQLSSNPLQPRLLLISGTEEGGINVHDQARPNDLVLSLTKVHDHAVNLILIDLHNNRMFSAATEDCTIIVWGVYPFAYDQPLSKMLTLYCGLRPVHMACIDNYLMSGFEDIDSAQFPIVVYDIQNNNRFDHAPSDDHVDPISSINSSRKMKIFLSSSSRNPGIIKIWTRKNCLLRQLETQLPIYTAVFSTDKADIIAAIGRQLCFISHQTILPKIYMKKQFLMRFNKEPESKIDEHPTEQSVNIAKNRQSHLSTNDEFLLSGIKPVFRYRKYVDILSNEEAEELKESQAMKQQQLNRLSDLERDIQEIKEGRHQINRDRLKDFIARPQFNEIFEHYVSQFLQYKPVSIPEDVKSDISQDRPIKPLEKYHPSHIEGFFPSAKEAKNEEFKETISPWGYIPNSCLISKLWPSNIVKEADATVNKPFQTDLDILQEELKRKLGLDQEEETKVFDWESDDESTKIELFDKPKKIEKEPEKPLSKFELALKEPPPPKLVKEESFINETSEDSMTPTKVEKKRPVSTTMTKENIKLPPLSRSPATLPDIKKVRFVESKERPPMETKESIPVKDVPKLEQKPVEVLPAEIVSDIPVMKREKSFFLTEAPIREACEPTSSASLLPGFVVQFIDEQWFQKICPPPYNEESCLKLLPDPLNEWSFSRFVYQQFVKSENLVDLCGFIEAFSRLYSQDCLEKSLLYQICQGIENKLNSIAVLKSSDEIEFFKAAIKFLASLSGYPDKGIVSICLTRFFDSDMDMKAFIKSVLCHLGLDEDNMLLDGELARFKLFSVRDKGLDRYKDLYEMVTEWLQKWYQGMLTFAEKCRNTISKEMAAIELKSEYVSNNALNTLELVEKLFHVHIRSSFDLMCLYPIDKSSKSLLSYVNCLNYFLMKNSSKKSRKSLREGQQAESGPKKTIIALPKLDPENQCLVRLGESNADALQMKRRQFSLLNAMWIKNAVVDYTQPSSIQPFRHYQIAVGGGGFVPYLHLYPKPCLVNPFPRPDDLVEWQSTHPKSLFDCPSRLFIQQMSLPPEPF